MASALACLLMVSLASLHPDVEAGRDAFQSGEFRRALKHLEDAQRSPTITEEDLVNLHWYRGAILAAQGKQDEAGASFDALLKLRPLHQPNARETPPELRALFKERQAAWQRLHGVQMDAPELSGATVVVRLRGDVGNAASVVAFVRAGGEATFEKVMLPVEQATARGVLDNTLVWKQAGRAGRLEFVLEARNVRGTPISVQGDAMQPLQVPVGPKQAQAALDLLKLDAAPAPTPPPVAAKPTTPPAAATPPTSATPPPEPPRTVVIRTPTAPAAEPAPPKVIVVEKQEERAPSSPVPSIAGGALFAGGALAGLGAVAAAAIAGAAWGVFGVLYYVLTDYGADLRPDRPQLVTAWRGMFVVGVVLPVVAALALVLGLGLGGGALAVLVGGRFASE